MKPNGRRRWRKWAKKQRAWIRHITGEKPARVRRGKCIVCPPDLYQGQMLSLWDDTGKIPQLDPRPFASRSLVGMSMGARKRAARACPGCIECHNEIPSIDHGVRCDSSGAFAAAGP